MKTFIDEAKIHNIIAEAKFSRPKARRIIKKALDLKGLGLKEAALLLNCDDRDFLSEIFNAASRVKELIYGKRVVLFAPLYLSNKCANDCLYCGFRARNKSIKRKRLSEAEIKKEVKVLLAQGHKRLLLVASESAGPDISYLEKAVKTVYETRNKRGAIRRVNVNVAPLKYKEFRRLKKAGIGTYQLFQETYHKETYKAMHTAGPKSDYYKRLYAMDIAQDAGIDDVGIGVLFGLYDYKFEVLGLLSHARYLEDKFCVGPHTISVPRIKPAQGAPVSINPPCAVSALDFKKIVAVLRLTVPYTGMILSTREKASLRNELLDLGISQISAGSRTNPGGYTQKDNAGQFSVSDNRSLKEVVTDMTRLGYIPSFCTACYRVGRTGEDFMDLAKPGDIHNFCLPNALLTFKEYALDYCPDNSDEISGIIAKEAGSIFNATVKEETLKKLKELEKGKRDLFF